jgi:hypothetical protein
MLQDFNGRRPVRESQKAIEPNAARFLYAGTTAEEKARLRAFRITLATPFEKTCLSLA